MSWFKRKDASVIPPVAEDNANSYSRYGSNNEQARNELLGGGGAPSRGMSASPRPGGRPMGSDSYGRPSPAPSADPYARPSPARAGSGGGGGGGLPSGPGPAPGRDRYNRNNGIGDPYARGRGDADADRAELFSGYDASKHQGGSGRFGDDPARSGSYGGGGEGDEEEDVEGIKRDMRSVKQESVNSTRNALRIAREAEETARNTLGRLGDQSEKLANTERYLDVSKGNANRVEDKQDELKQLNRSIFRPVITFNKDKKRAAEDAKLLRRHQDERDQHEKTMLDVRESQRRVARGYGGDDDEDEEEGIGGGGYKPRFPTEQQQAQRKQQRSRYQFEATASDDEMEDELDDNLDEIAGLSKKLKALGTAMGQELDSQNTRIDGISEKTDRLDDKLHRGIKRFDRIK